MVDIELRGQKYLSGLTISEREKIEQELTFKNPKYEQIMRYSKWSSTREPQYIEYFNYLNHNGELIMQVPLGYKLPKSISIGYVVDRRFTRVQKDFPEFLMTPRTTQKEAMDAFIESNKNPLTLSGSIQMPTGKGKTILGLAIAEHFKCRTLIIVHKTDLVTGWKEDIQKAFGGKADLGIIQAQNRKCGKHFTIATIQTLNRLSSKELDILYQTFGLIIQDEMHHCPSSSFSLADNFMSRYRLGLTATPERNDGLTHVMNLYYGDFCFRYSSKEDDEDILPVKVIKREVPTYFNPVVQEVKGKYSVGEDLTATENFDKSYELKKGQVRLSNIPYSNRPKVTHALIDGAVVDHENTINMVCNDIISEYEKGHSCIAFFTRVESVEVYAEALKSQGVPECDIGLYYGNNKNCDEVKQRAESQRKFITLATYSKATEGTNVKQWEVGFLVSSINTGKNVEQAAGRIRRTKEGCKLQTALLYDYRYTDCYQVSRHGATRDARYLKLKFDFGECNKQRSLFSRGYKRSI